MTDKVYSTPVKEDKSIELSLADLQLSSNMMSSTTETEQMSSVHEETIKSTLKDDSSQSLEYTTNEQTSNESSNSETAKVKEVAVVNTIIKSQCPFSRSDNNDSFLNNSTDSPTKLKKKKGVKLKYLLDDSTCLDTLYQKSITVFFCLTLNSILSSNLD